MIGMFVLSRYRYLKNNHFWLYNKYYLRAAEGGICGLVLFVVLILEFRHYGKIAARPTNAVIAAFCVTCTIKVLYSGLAVWSYFKMRRAMKAHETTQHQEDNLQTKDPYVQMLLGSVSLPVWHNLLSTFLIFLITTGFVTIPPSLTNLAEGSGQNDLFKAFVMSEPLYVQFHFIAF
jgi:hypothetical protein